MDTIDSGATFTSPAASTVGADTVRRSSMPNAADKNLFFDMEKTSFDFCSH